MVRLTPKKYSWIRRWYVGIDRMCDCGSPNLIRLCRVGNHSYFYGT